MTFHKNCIAWKPKSNKKNDTVSSCCPIRGNIYKSSVTWKSSSANKENMEYSSSMLAGFPNTHTDWSSKTHVIQNGFCNTFMSEVMWWEFAIYT